MARSVWSAWSLHPLSDVWGGSKAGASSTHSKRFARFGSGYASLEDKRPRQGVGCGHSAVHLPAAVIGDYDGVHAKVGGAPGVVGMENPLKHERKTSVFTQKRKIIPGRAGVGEDLGPMRDGGGHVLA